MAETIREFLVGLGFRTDQIGLNRFTQAIEGATLRAKLLGDAIEAMASRIVSAVVKTAEGFETLYYQSQRVGASAASIKALEYAVSQLGGSVGGADRALEGFSQKMRMNPKGFEEYLRKAWGVQTRDDKGNLKDSGELLIGAAQAVGKKFPGNHGAAVGVASDFLGIPDLETLLSLQQPGLEGRYKQGLGINKSAGIDEKSVSAATKFEQAIRETTERIGKYLEGAEARLFDALKGPLENLNKWLDANQGNINKALDTIADAIARVLTEWTEDAKKIDWPNAADDLVTFSRSVADFIVSLKDLITYLVALNEKSKDWWIVRAMNWASGQSGAAYGPDVGHGDGPPGGAGIVPGAPEAAGGGVGGWWRKTMPTWLGGSPASGPDTAGDKTTDWNGLKLKSGETVAGGAVDEGVLALAKHIQDTDPQFQMFTSLNDKYHHNLRYHSKHTEGLAFDATMKDGDYEAARGRSRAYLNSIGLKEGQDYWIEPGTDNHLHVQFQSHRAAQAYAAAAGVNANTTAAVGRRARATMGKPPGDWSTAPGAWDGINSALPVGAGTTNVGGNRTVNATVTNNVTVKAPETNAGSAVGANEDRTRADLARNLQPAVQ